MATEKVLTQPGNNEGVLSVPMVGIQTMGLYSPFPKDRTHSYRWNMLQVTAAEKVLTQPGNNEGVLSAPMVGIQTMGLYSPFPKD